VIRIVEEHNECERAVDILNITRDILDSFYEENMVKLQKTHIMKNNFCKYIFHFVDISDSSGI
jgi:hypothetical protein